MEITKQVLQAHKRQIRLSHTLKKVGYNSVLGKFLRFLVYSMDIFMMVKKSKMFLNTAKENIGDKFLGLDQAIIHVSHAEVKRLMQVQPQIRGKYFGMFRVSGTSYLLNNPLTTGMNGTEYKGSRAVISQSLPSTSKKNIQLLGNLVDEHLAKAAKKGELKIGEDIPKMILDILHQLMFEISLSEQEIVASFNSLSTLFIIALPNFVNNYLLRVLTVRLIKYRKYLIEKYKQSPKWSSYLETGTKDQLNEHQISNTLFDVIHLAGTGGAGNLLYSVIGVLCLDEGLRNKVISEVNMVWNGQETLNEHALSQSKVINKIILETARLYPPVRFVSQLSQSAGEVDFGEVKCPFQKGTLLLSSIFSANRDPKIYQNPNSFDIERDFSEILSWNEFGHERVCPGKSLSISLINLFCLYLFKKYKWESFTKVNLESTSFTDTIPNDLVLKGFKRMC